MVMCDVRDTNAGRYAGLAAADHGSGLSLCGFSAAGPTHRISAAAAAAEEIRGEWASPLGTF
jgi:hypothetical protein